MTFDEFTRAVELEVQISVGEGYTVANANYKRGNLKVSLFEDSGKAFVAYSAESTRGGHIGGVSSSYDLTTEGANRACADIVGKLNNARLYI